VVEEVTYDKGRAFSTEATPWNL